MKDKPTVSAHTVRIVVVCRGSCTFICC